ncbi:MAG TPA: glycosyltransferase family 2 protein [Fimbriiglobus sp.]
MKESFASVLIVNFNGARHIARCLSGLEHQTLPRYRFEVVVVDNASKDGSADVVAKEFPWVRLVRSKKNLGFASGNNLALSYARGPMIVLLNNDTVPDPYWLEELLREIDPGEPGVVASKLVFDANPREINSGGLTILRDGRGADAGFRRPDDGRFEAGGPVFAGCGAAVAVPVSPGKPVFDPCYFAYYEDLDLGWHNRLAGRPARLAARSVVRHIHGAAAGETSPLFTYLVERNRALTAVRNADPFLAVWSGLTLAAKSVRTAMRPKQWRHGLAVLKALGSYLFRLPVALNRRYQVRSWPQGSNR